MQSVASMEVSSSNTTDLEDNTSSSIAELGVEEEEENPRSSSAVSEQQYTFNLAESVPNTYHPNTKQEKSPRERFSKSGTIPKSSQPIPIPNHNNFSHHIPNISQMGGHLPSPMLNTSPIPGMHSHVQIHPHSTNNMYHHPAHNFSSGNYQPPISTNYQAQQPPPPPSIVHHNLSGETKTESTTSHNEVEHSTSTDNTRLPSTNVQPQVVPATESRSDFIKRQRRTAALIVIFAVVFLVSQSNFFNAPNYCHPEEITSVDISEMENMKESEGTTTIRSYSFSLTEEDLLLKLEIRNFGKPISNPTLRILFYNPYSKTNANSVIEDTFYLRDCKCSPLPTATKTLYIRIPFPVESALDMAMEMKTQLNIIIESDNKIVLNEQIHLTPDIIFMNSFLLNKLFTPIRVIVFGEQGSAKTTLINDFLNSLQGIHSKINFVPPPMGIKDAGMTVGVSRVAITNPHSSPLDSSIIFYDTEGASLFIFSSFFLCVFVFVIHFSFFFC